MIFSLINLTAAASKIHIIVNGVTVLEVAWNGLKNLFGPIYPPITQFPCCIYLDLRLRHLMYSVSLPCVS